MVPRKPRLRDCTPSSAVGRSLLRGVFAALMVVSLAGLVVGYVSWPGARGGTGPVFQEGEVAAPPANNTTVVTTSVHGKDVIVAFAPNGTVTYYNHSRDIYDDVDPSPEGSSTVTYVATDRLDRSECNSTVVCARNVIERVNLTTGETEVLYSRITTNRRNHWHDVERVGERRWLVADIALDRVFVVNVSTGLIGWEWDVQNDYDLSSGGLYPNDWTHLNDVELLDDGRVMVSLRNQDQVVFLDPETGLVENWTLGEDGNHSILYEQHNPDYIPPERGGPAVVVADSENNRVVEYERRDGEAQRASGNRMQSGDGEWVRTWQWSDVEMQWPRDADRLPNGNTLVVDTNGGRVLEVNRSGEVVWQVEVKGAYDAERLGTGNESAGGPAASRAGLTSRDVTTGPGPRPLHEALVRDALTSGKSLLPNMPVNVLLYVMPGWLGYPELAALLLLTVTGVAWTATEAYWSGWRLRSPFVPPPSDDDVAGGTFDAGEDPVEGEDD